MKKALVLISVLFLAAGLLAQTKSKEDKWQGHIVRVNKTDSSIDVRGGHKNMDQTDKRIVYDTSTQWTKLGKPAEQSEFKEGAYVIVAGNVDEKGVMHATQIDLRQR